MSIDVAAEVNINRPRSEVADYAMNPDNDSVWITGIVKARMLTDPPVALGTTVERIATFLGKRIEYVLEIVEYESESLIAMRSIKGPFPMDVRYEFLEASGGTLARIRIKGGASGFYKLAAPVLSLAVRRSIRNDLETLKDLLESGADGQ